MSETHTPIAIIGGSGLYQMDALQSAQTHSIDTPWGKPSDDIVTGTVDGVRVAFLARHGAGHRLIPSEVPYRANIYALKTLGVRYILSFSAVGSLRENIAPLHIVLPDQFIDLTRQRATTFFGNGVVAHVSTAQPVCPALSSLLAQAVSTADCNPTITLHQGGTYICIEGPQFSTLAESQWYRSMGATMNPGDSKPSDSKPSIIGMTNMPEAKLAREAELCYASVAMITDYDSWHPDHGEVDVTQIIETLMKNSENARTLVTHLPDLLGSERPDCPFGCDRALEYAIMTSPYHRDPELTAKLDAVAGRVLNR